MPRQALFPLSQPIFGEPVFSESGSPTPDPTSFYTPHPSDQNIYNEIGNLLYKDVVTFDPMRGQPGDLYELATAFGDRGAETIQMINAQGEINFHCAGDTGASAQSHYANEISVADALTNDIQSAPPTARVSFLYHVGDVVYDFGESQYYYDQFYEPFRNYPGPIFAIPGNHDSFIVPNTPAAEDPLAIFQRNFCATSPIVTPEAGSLHRTSGTQPGVYFTLDSPFVRIIGLFSNALEDPGIISSQSGQWPIPDIQLDYLAAQLQQVKDENYSGAVILATHHPSFVYAPPATAGSGGGGTHGSSPAMLAQIDTICAAQSVYPHAFLSGHAHNYQRYIRSLTFNGGNIQVPFIIIGNGGHNVTRLVSSRGGSASKQPNFGADVSYLDNSTAVQRTGLKLDEYDDQHYGFLKVTVNATQMTIAYNQVGSDASAGGFQPVTVNLAGHSIA